ncbi:hypothetical protein AB6A40_000882 [Gnathostoma spinigerum]|uniref:Uncharacterized protein n=1 Tax=Gnathostoma spinigerum TaxID=75299 RepID=A0ABD6EBL0_9BILA
MEEGGEAAKVTHVIFDLDGLLLDTEPVYTDANTKTMAKYGKTFNLGIKVATMGMKHDIAIDRMLEMVGLKGKVTVQEYSDYYDKILLEDLPNNKYLPGAMKLVKHLAAHKIPMAICTGSARFEFDKKVQNHPELLDLIPLHVLTGSDPDVKLGKPAPDGYLVTMKRFPSPPKSPANVLVFEDAPNGVLSAVAAGMKVVMVPDFTYASPPKEVEDKITAVLNSLEEFKPESVGLPAY